MNARSNLDGILSTGIPLEEFGVSGWGLQKGPALKAIRSLRNAGVPIFGGDDVYIQNNKLIYPYENWYCDQGDTETNTEYVTRCFEEALMYVDNYSRDLPSEPLFVLVAEPFAG